MAECVEVSVLHLEDRATLSNPITARKREEGERERERKRRKVGTPRDRERKRQERERGEKMPLRAAQRLVAGEEKRAVRVQEVGGARDLRVGLGPQQPTVGRTAGMTTSIPVRYPTGVPRP